MAARTLTGLAVAAVAALAGACGGGGDGAGPGWTREVLLERDPERPALLLRTAGVRVDDVLGDGTEQILVSEPWAHRVTLVHGCEERCEAVEIVAGLEQPVRARAARLGGDGRPGVLVADIGDLAQTDDLVGRVVYLEPRGDGFAPRILLDGVGRVSCAEPGDLDGDGDEDVVACVFGHRVGALLWLENEGGSFRPHVLRDDPGAVGAVVFDADGDGDADVAAAFSQNVEELVLFRNRGGARFDEEAVYDPGDRHYGMSGLEPCDVDGDGALDLLLTNGDYFDAVPFDYDELRRVHGLAWFSNDGSGRFARHDVVRALGAYASACADLDVDGDVDLVLSTLRSDPLLPEGERGRPGLFWLENTDAGFAAHALVDAPADVIALDVLPRPDGGADVVLGSYPLTPLRPSHSRLDLLRLAPAR